MKRPWGTYKRVIVEAAKLGIPQWAIAEDIGRSAKYVYATIHKARQDGIDIPPQPRGAKSHRRAWQRAHESPGEGS